MEMSRSRDPVAQNLGQELPEEELETMEMKPRFLRNLHKSSKTFDNDAEEDPGKGLVQFPWQ